MRDVYQIFCVCCLWPWLGPPVPTPAQTKCQGEVAILWVFFPIDNALYGIAFGTHTKTAEPIEMPFGMMSELGPRNSVLSGVTISEGKVTNLEKICLQQA